LIIKTKDFKLLSGKPKTISKKGDSGNEITSHFCGDCGSTLWRDGPSFPNQTIIKVGTLDGPDVFDQAKPVLELFASRRVTWVNEVSGADQKKTMT
jgi:hypothetical protein